MTATEDSTDSRTRSKRKRRHRHIGPNARALKFGKAFCPMCEADKIDAKRKASKFDRED